MDDNNLTVPYIVYEGELARAERMNKRLWVLIILLVCLLVGSNGAWLYYESQWQVMEDTTITQDVSQEAESGSNTFVGGDYYGKTESADNG